ncbi:hypothetical protein AB0J40_38000 [Amycolatopsis sp. NPDC049691]|uniref:hypothetical protein n=1 Tax=Amycolatopsis sp. NPDC049691 TaxID=3155155 RepID=UPI00341975F7
MSITAPSDNFDNTISPTEAAILKVALEKISNSGSGNPKKTESLTQITGISASASSPALILWAAAGQGYPDWMILLICAIVSIGGFITSAIHH